MKIVVTQEHINSGIPSACGLCPIAYAVHDAFGNYDHGVEVRNTYLTIDRIRYKLPSEATMFIRRFDSHESVKPFEFEISYNKSFPILK